MFKDASLANDDIFGSDWIDDCRITMIETMNTHYSDGIGAGVPASIATSAAESDSEDDDDDFKMMTAALKPKNKQTDAQGDRSAEAELDAYLGANYATDDSNPLDWWKVCALQIHCNSRANAYYPSYMLLCTPDWGGWLAIFWLYLVCAGSI